MLSRDSDSCRGNELLTWFDMFFDDVWVGLHTTVTIVRAPSTPNHRKWSIITVECGIHTALCKYEWRGILRGQHVTAGSDIKVFDQISHIHPWRPRLAAVHVAWQLAGCFSWTWMDEFMCGLGLYQCLPSGYLTAYILCQDCEYKFWSSETILAIWMEVTA